MWYVTPKKLLQHRFQNSFSKINFFVQFCHIINYSIVQKLKQNGYKIDTTLLLNYSKIVTKLEENWNKIDTKLLPNCSKLLQNWYKMVSKCYKLSFKIVTKNVTKSAWKVHVKTIL